MIHDKKGFTLALVLTTLAAATSPPASAQVVQKPAPAVLAVRVNKDLTSCTATTNGWHYFYALMQASNAATGELVEVLKTYGTKAPAVRQATTEYLAAAGRTRQLVDQTQEGLPSTTAIQQTADTPELIAARDAAATQLHEAGYGAAADLPMLFDYAVISPQIVFTPAQDQLIARNDAIETFTVSPEVQTSTLGNGAISPAGAQLKDAVNAASSATNIACRNAIKAGPEQPVPTAAPLDVARAQLLVDEDMRQLAAAGQQS